MDASVHSGKGSRLQDKCHVSPHTLKVELQIASQNVQESQIVMAFVGALQAETQRKTVHTSAGMQVPL